MTTYIVRTRHEYGSYYDFFELARLSGYPIIYVDEIEALDNASNAYIVSPVNGEWNHWEQGRIKGKLILYQLEHNLDGLHNTPAAVHEVWSGDKWEAETNGFRYVPMGSHAGLDISTASQHEHKYDVIPLAYRTPRRQMMEQCLGWEDVTFAPSEGVWGRDRSDMLHQSKIMLHIHQWGSVPTDILDKCKVGHDYGMTPNAVNMPVVTPLRWCICAAHKLPLITETVNDRGVFGMSYMLQADFKYIAQFIHYILKDHYKMEDYALALHDLLCRDYTFTRMIESHL